MKKPEGNKSYFKSITTLMSGSMIANVFTFICSPILTRICSPEVLGIYSLVTGAITMFGMIMSLRFEMCIVFEPEEKKVYPLIKLSMILNCVISALILIGYLIYFFMIDTGGESFIVLALITALLAFLMGVINIVTAYNNRHKDYKLITKTYVIRVFFQNALNLVAGFFKFGAIGLSLSQLIGYMAGIRGQAKPLKGYFKEIKAATKAEMKEAALSNKKQAMLSTPAALANGLSYSLINYFIEALFTTAIVGYYSISYRILGLPITIISTNVSRVFLERASKEYQEKGNFRNIYKSTVLLLLAMGIPIGILLVIFSPWACELFFGEGWGVAGVYIRLLTPMFIMRFIAGGVNGAAIIVNKQQYDLIIQLLLTGSLVAIFIISMIFQFQVEIFLTILNAVFCVIYLVYIYLFWLCAKGNKQESEV